LANAQPRAIKPPALASADCSVNGAHNLAANPPSLDALQDFYDRAFGAEESLNILVLVISANVQKYYEA
jgi:hypothetical protein